MNLKIISLRCHHLVCLSNFIGKGYDLNFIENMKKIEEFLKANADLNCIKIVAGFDDLCRCCPNKQKNADKISKISYLNFESCSFSSVAAKDLAYLNLFDFRLGDCVSLECVLNRHKVLLNDEMFLKICGTCRWFDLCVEVRASRKKIEKVKKTETIKSTSNR